MRPKLSKKDIDVLIRSLGVLVVDDNQYMRRVTRNLLVNIGVREVFEAADGLAGLEAIRTVAPDVVVLEWHLPMLNGAEFVRIVRSPGLFPMADIPIVMLSAHGERWRVLESIRLGVNEYVVKPASAKALRDRFVSILAKPRPIVQYGDYYGPEPRQLNHEPMRKSLFPPAEAPASSSG